MTTEPIILSIKSVQKMFPHPNRAPSQSTKYNPGTLFRLSGN